jgi:uncharacterized protein (DUF1800 family)
MIARRTLIAATAGLAAGCKPVRTSLDPRQNYFPDRTAKASDTDRRRAVHLLSRAAFSPTPALIEDVLSKGIDGWLDHQLTPPTDVIGPASYLNPTESTGLHFRLNSLPCLRPGAIYELRDVSQPRVLSELSAATILRSTYSQWQLRERMCQFWTNHFNIYGRKVATARGRKQADAELLYFLADDQRTVIRPHALGKFQDLIDASIQSPAMLGYLDNQLNKSGNVNENYARELLELHTLGVDGGYTQADVKNVAKVLSGWTIEDGFLKKVGSVIFDKGNHTRGEKLVLGTSINEANGERERDKVVELVANHPSTARYITSKLVNFYCGADSDTQVLKESSARVFEQSGGAMDKVLRNILLSDAFYASKPKFRQPFDYLIACLRATNADTSGLGNIQYQLERMGQPLHQWPMPDGYPDITSAWVGNMIPRWQFALDLGSNSIQNTAIDKVAVKHLCRNRFPTASDTDRLTAVLASPEFQWA